MVMGLLVRATADTERALDLTAEVFAAALSGARRFRSTRSAIALPKVGPRLADPPVEAELEDGRTVQIRTPAG